jgi:IS605 OrfB family transposase
VDYQRLDMVMYGKSSGQRLAILHDLASILVKEALSLRIPLVIESLDFQAKKLRLGDVGMERSARRLSSFAYSRFGEILKAHARLCGVAVVEVNPAYTSVIGAALHAVPKGLTIHGAAALAIARRGMGCEETIDDRLRIWRQRRKPLAIKRPTDLRSKASVNPYWPGWKSLANAVHVARDAEQQERLTGNQRRKAWRDERRHREDMVVPY